VDRGFFNVGQQQGVVMEFRKVLVTIATSATLAFATSSASAETFSFYSITNNDPVSSAIGEAQLSGTVVDVGGNAVFTFSNSGPEASSIAQIYFDNGSPSLTLASISGITNGPGVNFVEGASPGNLPGANNITPGFNTSFSLLASATAPASVNGVNPGEWVSILFNYVSGSTFADVVGDLNSGALRVGMHVIGFDNGRSEAFVTPIPEPETYALMLAGLALLGFAARRKRNNSAGHDGVASC